MSNLFELNAIKNHPSRSSFDLSKHQPFTAKAGELLPVYRRLVYPGDKFRLGHQHFTRTQPVNTAAFVRIREYFDWYFVPLRLLNKNLGQALVQMQNNPVQASGIISNKLITTDIPYTSLRNIHRFLSALQIYGPPASGSTNDTPVLNYFGFNTAALGLKLLQYLGYGNVFMPGTPSDDAIKIAYTSDRSSNLNYNSGQNMNVNLLFLFAYQKIYSDFFRFSQWEANEPFTYNVDYYSGGDFHSLIDTAQLAQSWANGHNFLTMRYANWNKDMFMGVLPDQQLGDVASITLNNLDSGSWVIKLKDSAPSGPYRNIYGKASGDSSSVPVTFTADGNTPSGHGSLVVNAPSLQSGFNILQLRMAEALQRFREISQVADQDYRSQLEAHWNVRLSRALSDQCQWIGGSVSQIDISEVENTNLSDSTAVLKGKGVGSGQSIEEFTANEHGVLMCIYHAVPLLNHSSTGQAPDLNYTNTADLPQPEFDRIGLQSLPLFNYFNAETSYSINSAKNTPFPIGYLPRYYEAKTDFDTVLGAFRTTLKSWVVTLSTEYLSLSFENYLKNGAIGYTFFKVNPSVMDSIFAVRADSSVDTDTFLVNCFFDVKAVRNFDYDGMPY